MGARIVGLTEDFSDPVVVEGSLLERERELAALDGLLARSATGSGGAVAVVGPAGIGKTSLLRMTAAMADRHGLRRLSARATEVESDFSYGVVKQLLDAAARELDAQEREAAFSGAARGSSAVVGVGVGGALPGSVEQAFAVVHALYWLCANLAQLRPLALVVDDVHWADTASLRFLAYLTPRTGELPIALVTGARPLPEGRPADLIEAVTMADSVISLSPAPLSVSAFGRLVEKLSGRQPAAEFARACHAATGGNPFLCAALMTALGDEGVEGGPEDARRAVQVATRAIATVVVRRLGRLSPAANAVASAVAVLGAGVELRHAAVLAGLALEETASAADDLGAQGIFSEGHRLEFVHPLVRSCVYDRIPPARRSLLHAHAARALHAGGADETQVASHLLLAEPGAEEWVVEVLMAASAHADAQGDPTAAAKYLHRALEEPPRGVQRPELLHRLGVAELHGGEADSAAEHLRAAYAVASSGASAADIGHDLALALSTRGHYADAVAVLEDCVAQAAASDPDRAMGIEAELHQSGLMDPSQYRRVSARIDRLTPDPRGDTPGERALLAALATEGCLKTEPAETVRGLAARAFERGLLADHVPYASLWANAAFPLIFAEGYDAATDAVEQAIAVTSRRGSPIGLARAHGVRATLQFRRGDIRDAEADARASVEHGLSAGYLVSLIPLGVLVETLVARDELAEAEQLLVDHGRSGGLNPGFLESWVLHARGWLRLAQDRAVEAAADFDELGRRGAEGWRPWNPGMFAFRSGLALARWRMGQEAPARTIAAEEVEWASRWRGRRALGIALRTAGQVTRGPNGLQSLRESVEVLEGSGAALEHAVSLIVLGAALRRDGKRRDASRALHDGMDLAHHCGALAPARLAREELVALGERPRRAARHGVDALTPSERRVARLAAAGMANREIAQSLFVTVRTVEVHLTSAYRKLGTSARDGLAAALGDGR